MKTKEPVTIFFTVDNNYAPYVGVALTSLTENASPDRDYRIYVIHENISGENEARLMKFNRDNFRIICRPMRMPEISAGIDARKENLLRCDFFTMTIFVRLFLAEMFPEIDKAIYLDSDIIVPGDISRLYDTELGDNLIGACPDSSVSDVPPLVDWIEEAVGVNRYKYINSGILVLNLKKMREVKFLNFFLSLMNCYHFESIAPDQDYLNAICEGHITYLDPRWDVMPNPRKPEHPSPSIIHYNLFDKPWFYDDIMYGDRYWEVCAHSDFHEHFLALKAGYTDEQKARDKETLDKMIATSKAAIEKGVTFAKIGKETVNIKY